MPRFKIFLRHSDILVYYHTHACIHHTYFLALGYTASPAELQVAIAFEL